MKRLISLTLLLLMLVTLTLTATSCEFSLESKTGYTQFRDHIVAVSGDKLLALDDHTTVKAVVTDSGDREVHVNTGAEYNNPDRPLKYQSMRITLVMNGSVEKAKLFCDVVQMSSNGSEEIQCSAEAEVLLTHYTGNELIEFTSTKNMDFFTETDNREFATSTINSLLLALDTYMTNNLDLTVRDLGFIVLSDKYMASTGEAEVEEDLGGAFSSARLQLAGLMILMGVGMVFLVLAILWMVLVIFKMIFAKDSANAEKAAKDAAKAAAKAEKEAAKTVAQEAEKAAAAPAPAPASDDQLIAVITAAVAAAIEADPALSSQFASGFRVVSFKKTDKSRTR